ncbi:hypothetical protein [Streptomyces californicus]
MEEASGGHVVVAEGVRDDGGGQFDELLSDGGAVGRCDRDVDLAQEREDTDPNEPVMRLLRDGTAASLRR